MIGERGGRLLSYGRQTVGNEIILAVAALKSALRSA
jgi:hypothetical protein